MSKVTKIICDKCGRELDVEEWYYYGSIISTKASISMGARILDGDYCKKCFKEIIERQFSELDKQEVQ